MRVIVIALAIVLALCAGLLGRSHFRHASVPPSDTAPAPTAPISARVEPVTDAGTEPDEATLRRLDMARADAIEKAGGMPVVITQTGTRATLHPKVWTVHKDECHKATYPVGSWDCSLSITITLVAGDQNPLPQGERISVRRNAQGEWVLI